MIGPDKPIDYPDAIRECWAVHQALRTLGFSPDDIYVTSGHSVAHAFNPPAMFVVLKTQEKEFVITLGLFETSAAIDHLLMLWTEFAQRWNAQEFAQEEMDAIYKTSNVMKNSAEFVIALEMKGISCPFRMS